MFVFHKSTLHPKYWVLLLILGFFWCLSRLPYSAQISLGRRIGAVIYRTYKKARHVMTVNIRLCFPHLNEQEHQHMVRVSATELGISIAETFLIWFRNNKRFLKGRFTIEGIEHYQDALKSDKGIILLACHHGCVDLNAALISSLDRGDRQFVGTYRQTDDFVNRFLQTVRGKYCDALFAASDQRNVVKQLKRKNIIWYAPDIEVKSKNCAFVDFMGVTASTTIAISRLSKITGALVVPIAHYRTSDKPKYRLKIFPALQNFPSDNVVDDTSVMNKAIEAIIEPHPERYWWAIKRFKHQPDGRSVY